MKKFWIVAVFFVLVLVPTVLAKQVGFAAQEPADGRYETMSQEAQRNRELLEIWKDHVKTLTKERDAAYKELEKFKIGGVPLSASGTPVAQFGGIETQALPSAGAAGGRELQMQFSALQSQLQQVRKELGETRTEKDRIIQEKEKALSQVERMKSELENAPSSGQVSGASGQDQVIAENLQKALNIQKKRYENLQSNYSGLESEVESLKSAKESDSGGVIRNFESQLAVLRVENQHLKSQLRAQVSANIPSGNSEGQSEEALREAREIRYENETLKARIEKLQAVEKELSSARAYFTPLVKELQTKNQELIQQVQQFSVQDQKLSSNLQSAKAEQEEATSQIAELRSQLQMAAADKDKYKGMEEEMQRLSSENKTLHQAYSDLEAGAKSQTEELRAHETENAKQI